jgi:hypothetical protein
MNQNNKLDWAITSMVVIVISSFIGMGLSEYISYLSAKQKNETIRTAISNQWSIEQIQGLLNSKN